MYNNFPISSAELNDILMSQYEQLIYLLGYTNVSGVIMSGLYDVLDRDITNTFVSGILSLNDNAEFNLSSNISGYSDISDFLKMDYIYTKFYQSE